MHVCSHDRPQGTGLQIDRPASSGVRVEPHSHDSFAEQHARWSQQQGPNIGPEFMLIHPDADYACTRGSGEHEQVELIGP